MLFLLLFMSVVFAKPDQADKKDYQVIQIYVDISRVTAPNGTVGTSVPLNTLISHYAQLDSLLEHKLNRYAAPSNWEGEINVYDWTNVQYMPTFKKCDYGDAIKCGIQNNHWTLRTVVSVGQKYSVFTQKLYDNKGHIISQSSQTAWGTIRWKPRWKLTKIKEQGPFGGGSKEIFEMWPPQMEELPPLIKPYHVGQARYGVYEVDRSACKLKACD